MFIGRFIVKRSEGSTLYADEKIGKAYRRFRSFFRFSHNDGRVVKLDQGLNSFYELWKSCVPARHHGNRVRCELLGNLIKFHLICYAVKHINQSVNPEDRLTISPVMQFRRTVQK